MCGSAAATLTHPLGSTNNVAGGEARLSASPAPTSNGSYQSSMMPSSSRAIRSSTRRKFSYCSAFGPSLSHSLAAVPMRISRPVLTRNAPSARARATTELGTARAHALDHREEMRMQHRLASRERQVRDVVVQELVDDGEHSGGVELVAEGLARTALLDAVQAGEIALVRDLPRDVERRAQVLRLGGRRKARRPGSLSRDARCEIGHAVSHRGARARAAPR